MRHVVVKCCNSSIFAVILYIFFFLVSPVTVDSTEVVSAAPIQHVFGRKIRPLSSIAKRQTSRTAKPLALPVVAPAFEKEVLEPIPPETGEVKEEPKDEKVLKRQRRIICCLLVALLMSIAAGVAAVAAVMLSQDDTAGKQIKRMSGTHIYPDVLGIVQTFLVHLQIGQGKGCSWVKLL